MAGTSPFLVYVGRVLRTGEPRRERRAGVIDDLFVTGSEVPPGAEVGVDVLVERLGGAVEVIGRVEAPWQGQCRRCLQPVTGRLGVEVRELFEHHPVED